MKKLFRKIKAEGFYKYGFIRRSSDFMIDIWDGYSVKNIEKISELSNKNILNYSDVEYFAYITLISLFFDPTKNNYAIYQSYFEKDKNEYVVDGNFTLNISYETIETDIEKLSLYDETFERKDNCYIKGISNLKDLFSYHITTNNYDSSQGITFIVTDKALLVNSLSLFLNKEVGIERLLDDISYIIIFEVGHDLGDINGFNIYSRNDIENDICKIEKAYLSHKNIFNKKLKNIVNETDFIKALEVFIGSTEKNKFVWQ